MQLLDQQALEEETVEIEVDFDSEMDEYGPLDFVAGMMREQLSRGGIVVAATHQPLDFGAARVSRLALGG